MEIDTLKQLVIDSLEDLKARDVRVLDVRGMTAVTDWMVIAGGTSDRHVKSLASRVVEQAKEAGYRPLSVEGEQAGEWILVDLGDVVLHIMQPAVRDFYQLEKLWSLEVATEEEHA